MNNEPTPMPSHEAPEIEQSTAMVPVLKSKKSKRLWVILSVIGGVILLAVILLIALFSSLSDTTQKYQNAVDGALGTSSLYGDYTVAVAKRAYLTFGNSQDNVTNFYGGKTALTDKQTAPYDDKERLLAKDIAAYEKYFDEAATKLKDKSLRVAYDDYLAARTKLYGKNGSIEKYVEKSILAKKLSYSCEDLLKDGPKEVLFSDKFAKLNMPYVEGCIAVLQKAASSDSFDEDDKANFKIAADYYTESASLAKRMLASGEYNTDKFTELEKTYGEKLGKSSAVKKNDSNGTSDKGVTMDDVSDKLDIYFNLAINKRNKTPGNSKEDPSKPQIKSPGSSQDNLNNDRPKVEGIKL